MRYFIDNRCSGEVFEWEGPGDPTKCLICGQEGKVGEHLKELPPLRLVFQDKNEICVYIHKNEVIGRDVFRLFEDYKYVSKEQFKLKRELDKGWSIEAIENTANPTFLNGEKLEPGKTVMIDHTKDNDILIGNIETGLGLKLKIKFE